MNGRMVGLAAATAMTTTMVVVAMLVIKKTNNNETWWQWWWKRRKNEPPPCTITDLVGSTPIIQVRCLSVITQPWKVYVKCEHLNPFGSGKDRVALKIVEEAMDQGTLVPLTGTIIEGTSGSTGISLARVALAKQLKCIVVVPDDQAMEKTHLLRMFGADVRKVKPVSIVHPDHYVNVARRLANEIPGAVFANQFENDANFRAHVHGTGPEIWDQIVTKLHQRLDLFICSAGTGGTIAGVGSFLKHKSHNRVRVILADPPGSSLFHRVENGVMYAPEQRERSLKRNRVDTICEGIGIDRLTANFAKALPHIDGAVRVSDRQAALMARFVLHREGLFVGSSTAVNLCGVVLQWKAGDINNDEIGGAIVTIMCSSGEREGTKIHSDEFCIAHGILHNSDVEFFRHPFDDEAFIALLLTSTHGV